MTYIKNIYVALFGFSAKEWSAGLIIGTLGGVLANMVGGNDEIFQILLWAMALDVFTGVYCKALMKQVSSTKGIAGIHRKVGILIMIAFATKIDVYMGQTGMLRNGAIALYIGMEGLSLLENLTAMGVVTYGPIRDVLIQLKEGNKKGPSILTEIPTPADKQEG